jgi:tetratricopeptide (TPR) repeat protein
MKKNPYRDDRDQLKELIRQYHQMKLGKHQFFIEEEEFLKIIEYFLDNQQNEDALDAAEMATEQFPYSAPLQIIKADTLLTMRRYPETIEVLDKAALLDRNDASIYIIKTDALLAMDLQEEAAELLESVLDFFEGDDKIDLLFELGDVYDDYENFQKVFDCLKLILELDPENEEALYKICFWTDYTGRNEEGIKLHQHILDYNPFNELAWFNLGAAFQGIKLYEKSIDAYQYAVAINEKFDYAYRNMGDAFIRLKKYKEAIESLEKVLELSPPEALIFEAIGHCYDKMKNFAQARFYYKKASHLQQEDSQLHYKIACTYMNEEIWGSAIKSLQVALKYHSFQADYNLALGRCYLQTDNFDEAIVYLGNFVRIRPKNIHGWTELLNCMYQGALYEEGIEYAGIAFEQTDGKSIFLFYKSAFLFANSRSKEALIYLEHGLSSNPKQIRQFLEINPSILQNQMVVDLISKYKKSSSRKK